MKTKHLIPSASSLALVLLSTLNPQLSTMFAQGSLTPPGAPAPTMKTLAQVEPRTPISSAPYTITTPGSYYLTTNLTVSTGNGITISSDGVTLDLNGFTICSTAPAPIGYGMYLPNRRNITIRNGFITGGVTNNGSGIYSGTGFSYGIYGASSGNVLVNKISVSGCRLYGIYLSIGYSTVVESCTVQTVGSHGIRASTVKGCSAADCGGTAIAADEASDSRGQSSSDYGVSADIALNCYGSGSGVGLYAFTAQSCYGSSSGASGYGVAATTALNCRGYSSGGGYGVYATSAQNCYGYSSSGYGLYASTASGCYGYSSSGTGLSAFIANVCHGATSTGTALSTTHNVNSY